MKVVFVYVVGKTTCTPTCSRGYKSLAHDIVTWWDKNARLHARTSDLLQLRRHIISALRGLSSGGIRAIRPAHKGGTDAVFDDLIPILDSSDVVSERMRRVRDRLEVYCSHAIIPRPVIDAPAEVHLCEYDTHTQSRTQTIETLQAERSMMRAKEMTRIIEVHAAHTSTDIVILYDVRQDQYIRTIIGSTTSKAIKMGSALLLLRSFISKEKLAPGLPLMPLTSRLLQASRHNQAEAMLDICLKLCILDLIPGVSKVCGISWQDAISKGTQFRCMRMISLPNESAGHGDQGASASGEVTGIQGGHVIEPTRPLVDAPIAIVDFASLYPSIIVAEDIASHIGIPQLVSSLMDRRRQCAERDPGLANAYKIMANSFYGQLACPTSPLYNHDLASRITSKGRAKLSELAVHLGSYGGEVIYGDTDSCMVTFPQVHDIELLHDKISECVAAFNTKLPSPMRVAVQDVYKKAIFLSKKKYVALKQDDSVHFIGTVNVRGDLPSLLHTEFAQLASYLLRSGGSFTTINRMMMDARAKFRCAGPSDMTAVRRLTGPARSGPGSIPAHVELARCEQFRDDGLGYDAGDSIEFVPTTRRSPGSCGHRTCLSSPHFDCGDIAWKTIWRLFQTAALNLITASTSEDMASKVAEACRQQDERDRAVHESQSKFLFAAEDDDETCTETIVDESL